MSNTSFQFAIVRSGRPTAGGDGVTRRGGVEASGRWGLSSCPPVSAAGDPMMRHASRGRILEGRHGRGFHASGRNFLGPSFGPPSASLGCCSCYVTNETGPPPPFKPWSLSRVWVQLPWLHTRAGRGIDRGGGS